MIHRFILAGFFWVACASISQGEIVSSAADGFEIAIEIDSELSTDASYAALTKSFNQWWDASHSYSGNPKNLSIDLEKCCMLEKLEDGGFVRHMEVVFHQPGKVLRLSGGLGPLQSMGVNGALTFTFVENDGKAKIQLKYIVSGYSKLELDKIAGPVNMVLSQQMDRLQKYCQEQASK